MPRIMNVTSSLENKEVWNAYEFGLFYRQPPNWKLAKKSVSSSQVTPHHVRLYKFWFNSLKHQKTRYQEVNEHQFNGLTWNRCTFIRSTSVVIKKNNARITRSKPIRQRTQRGSRRLREMSASKPSDTTTNHSDASCANPRAPEVSPVAGP